MNDDELNSVEAKQGFEAPKPAGNHAGQQSGTTNSQPVTQSQQTARAKQLRTARQLIIIPSLVAAGAGLVWLYFVYFKQYPHDKSGLSWSGNTLIYGVLFFIALLHAIPCIIIGIKLATQAGTQAQK